MKIIHLFYCLLFILNSGTSQSYTNKKGDKHLWGTVNIETLSQPPYSKWYDKDYQEYNSELSPDNAVRFKDLTVKIFIGTWCGDTHYLLPRFMKTWHSLGLADDQLEIIAVHNEEKFYKQGPTSETQGLNIHRVPTFIFEREDKEIGRIVERTVFDLDTDLMLVAGQQAYHPRYRAVSLLDSMLDTINTDSLDTKTQLVAAYKKVRREVMSSSELNTYGYVLIAQNKWREAEYILKLNRFLFPYNPNVRDSYGEALMNNEKYEAAKKEYMEAIRLKPENENAIKRLAELNRLIQAQDSDL